MERLKELFEEIIDVRDSSGKRHCLMHIMVISVCAILCGYNDFEDIGTAMDFYTRTSSFWGSNGNNIEGSTRYFNLSGANIAPNKNNWLWSQIDLNSTTLSGQSTAKQQATAEHEMGHAFGLDEYFNAPYRGSIMYPYSAGPIKALTVQQEDNDAINAKY